MNYHKKIEIAPDFFMTIRKRGFSPSVDVRSSSITFGKNGRYVNTGIPGTGYYERCTPSGVYRSFRKLYKVKYPASPANGCAYIATSLLCLCAGVLFMMVGGFCILLGIFFFIGAWVNYKNLKKINDPSEHTPDKYSTMPSFVAEAQEAYADASDECKRQVLGNFINIYELSDHTEDVECILEKLRKSPRRNLQLITEYEAELDALKIRFEREQRDVDKEVSEKQLKKYEALCQAFEPLLNSEKIWVITDSTPNTARKSSAQTTIQREAGNIYVGVFDYLKSKYDAPVFDLGKQQLYFYPSFAILAYSPTLFSVVDYNSLTLVYRFSRFQETEKIPSDSKLLCYTWKYVNKDGEPDRRYTHNPQIPVVGYGTILLNIPIFGDITFQFSHAESAEAFAHAFTQFRSNSHRPKVKTHQTSPKCNNHYYPIAEAANRLYKELLTMNEDEEVIAALKSERQLDVFDKLDQTSHLTNRLAFVVCADVMKCYLGLGHGRKMKSDEGIGLSMMLAKIITPSRASLFDTEEHARSKEATHLGSQLYEIFTEGITLDSDPDKFLLIEILRRASVDEETINKYAVFLYRYAMAIAQADNEITTKERDWLANILSFTDIHESTNIDNDDEEEELEKEKEEEVAPQPKKSVAKRGDALKELKSLIGLEAVKTEVQNIYNLIHIQKIREHKGLKSSTISYHCVFTGNPGTGKTTIARLIAQIYKDLGILKKGHLVETDRSGLVAEYVGQTAVKTNKIIDSALDGVLFIDEAYALVQGGNNDYGMEAIATLLKRMEDDRERLVVILAGYSEEMQQFIQSNPGLQSRFNRYIHFDDYEVDDLVAIYELNLRKYDYQLSDEGLNKLRQIVAEAVAHKDQNFGNARFVRNLFEKTIERQAHRLASVSDLNKEVLAEITDEDIPE